MTHTTTHAALYQECAQELLSIGKFARETNAKYSRLEELNKLITANEAALNKQFIKVPFTKFRLLDDTGILKPKVPVLLDENKRLVSKYNKLLEETQINYDIIRRKEYILGQKLQTLTEYPDAIKLGNAIVGGIDKHHTPDFSGLL